MKLSIVVPVYNIEEYIAHCIESILSQTYKDFEVILVDDGSVDDSGHICDEFAKIDKRVRVIHQQNKGLVAARKTGVQSAVGEYIGFVDGDDWVEADMYQLLLEKIDNGYEVAICDYYLDYSSHFVEYHNKAIVSSGEMKPQLINTTRYFEFFISPNVWNKVYKRENLISIQAKIDDQITIGEDAAITFPYFDCIRNVGIVDKCCYHYRQNNASMTHRYNDNLLKRVELLFGHLATTLMQKQDKQIELYRYFMAILCIKNEALDNCTVWELNRRLHKIIEKQWMKETIQGTILPEAKLFDRMLDWALKRRISAVVIILLKAWKMHMGC